MTRAFDRAHARTPLLKKHRDGFSRVKLLATLVAEALCGALLLSHCTTIDPGDNIVIPDQTFDADYFFCHVEPELLIAKKCGPGDPALGDTANGCHFNSSAVSGMALLDHPAVDCGGGEHPLSTTQVGSGSPAQGNLQAASLEMNQDYLTAPIFVRPTQNTNHPRAVYQKDDPVVEVLKTWALK